MASGISFKVTKNRLPAIAKQLPEAADVIVRRNLEAVRDGAARRSRVDKGEMRAGWAVEMTGQAEGQVVNPVEHTAFNEYGTRNMSAQPMLRPAMEQQRGPFEDDMRSLESLLK